MRIVVAEDQLIAREGVVRLLGTLGHEVVGEAASLPELMAVVGARRPDVVVADLRMPPTFADEGIVAARDIRAAHDRIAVLVLSQHVEVEFALELLDGAPGVSADRASGGVGYLLKDRLLRVDELQDALARVNAGEVVIDPALVERLMVEERPGNPLDVLSPREREVLALVAEGMTTRGIAERLFLSENTIDTHIRAVFAGLGLDDASGNKRVLAVLTYLEAQA